MIFLLPATILAITGWLIKFRKVAWLISGYNTASAEQKKQYDIEKLCNYMGSFMFALAGIFLAMAGAVVVAGEYSDTITQVGFCVLVFALVCGIVYLNTGNRVKKTRV